MQNETIFEVGGRYRNREGWYEVLDILNGELLVRYEHNGLEIRLTIETQRRIIRNILQEEERITPYQTQIQNQRYFRMLGYIAMNGSIEAIIPPRSLQGFRNTYSRIKGNFPDERQDGYYVHHDEDVDKWGVEMRLSYPRHDDIQNMEFGENYNPVESPDPNILRVNSNELCYQLLGLGYNLGNAHNIEDIISNIPADYIEYFREGLEIT